MTGGEMNGFDSAVAEPFELPEQDGFASHRHKAFRPVTVERLDSRSFSSQQNNGLLCHGNQDAKPNSGCQTAESVLAFENEESGFVGRFSE